MFYRCLFIPDWNIERASAIEISYQSIPGIMKMEDTKDINTNSGDRKLALKVSTISIVINLVLSVAKLVVGIMANSGAMVSDAVHSLSDVFSTFIVIIGVNISSKKSDDEHPYGHERLESVASIILASILFSTGVGIGVSGIGKIVNGNYGALKVPGMIALMTAIISIAVKEWMYWFTRSAAKKINSGVLMADAWHHRSDALSSVGAFIGIAGARLGFPVMDPVASVAISIFIVKAAFDIFKEAVDKMIDRACDEETIKRMEQLIDSQEDVLQIDKFRTRLFGSKIYVEVEIAADGKLTLDQSHEIANRVHDVIEQEFPEVKHCMVRVNPKNITV